jgi:hypothetical protein
MNTVHFFDVRYPLRGWLDRLNYAAAARST